MAGYTPKDVRAFWERQRAMPWTMAVCGQFDRKMVLDVAARLAAPAVAARVRHAHDATCAWRPANKGGDQAVWC